MFEIDKHGDISAHLEDYIQGFEAYAASICLNLDDDGMLGFYLHLSDAELILRHPGATRKPPLTKPVCPLDTDPNFDNKLKLFFRDEKKYENYREGAVLLIQAFYDYLTEDLKTKILRASTGGMAAVTCRSIYTELKSQFGEFSDSARQELKRKIAGPLNLSLSLQTNLTNMLSANTCLASHNVGYRDWELFDFAYEKLISNERTKDIALRYKTDSNFSHPTVSFAHFSKFMQTQYDITKSTLPESTASAAFHGDPVKSSALYSESTFDVPNIAAAVISPGRQITLSEKEYEALVKMAHSPSPKKHGNPSPHKDTAPGYCLLHGFCTHGPGLILKLTKKPAYCRTMSDEDGNPKAPYTKKQVMCNSSKGGPIDKLPRCQDAQAGFTKP
jgi:hypothetical protein